MWECTAKPDITDDFFWSFPITQMGTYAIIISPTEVLPDPSPDPPAPDPDPDPDPEPEQPVRSAMGDMCRYIDKHVLR